jgi:ribonuclease HI|tara:strand:- start:1073 stop:1540 length:468 start_codon:yes stop_codon:yes gene_type:complete
VVISRKIELFTDGACKGNPGLGGWGVLIINSKISNELKGTQQQTTNNRMELIAVIEGLKSIKGNAHIEITTDSMYVKNGINQWINNWKNNGWKTAAKKPVKNKDLWQELDDLVQNYSIKWVWVKGHSGHTGNERADQLANEAIAEFQDKNNTLIF